MIDLTKYPYFSIDVETKSLDWGTIFGITVAAPDGMNIYVDIRRQPEFLELLRKQAPHIRKAVNHNMSFDLHQLEAHGIYLPPERCECTMVRAALIDEHLKDYSLDGLLKRYIGMEKYGDIYSELSELFGGKASRNVQMPNLHRAPEDMVRRYALPDSQGALKLWEWQEEEIARQDLNKVWDLEKRLFPHVIKMERTGIRVDMDAAQRTADNLAVQIKQMQQQMDHVSGIQDFNSNSPLNMKAAFEPQQLPDGKWKCNDGSIVGSTPSGAKASFNKDSLESMSHPLAALILAQRKLLKAKGTFIESHIMGHAVKKGEHYFVHPNINQTKGDFDSGIEGTGTGRLSYTRPALQQIPARDKQIAAIVRPVFLPDEHQDWSYGDLEQHEYRIFAHYANNEKIIGAYEADPDLDFHQQVSDLTGLPRSAPKSGGANAKQLNLGAVFCMGDGAITKMCGLPYTMSSFIDERGKEVVFEKAGPEGQALIEKYHQMVPGIREVAKQAKRIAKNRGFIKTMMGRHIRFPRGMGARKASGLLYQGSSADLNKLNMCLIAEYLESECPDGRLLLNIHDEYSVSLPRDGKQVHHLCEIRRLIEDKPFLRVPIRIDFGRPSCNWLEATKADIVTS